MKDQLMLDKAVLQDCKKRRTNVAMAWLDYKKAYDSVPHSWIRKTLEMIGAAKNIKLILKTSLTSKLNGRTMVRTINSWAVSLFKQQSVSVKGLWTDSLPAEILCSKKQILARERSSRAYMLAF